MRQSLYYTPSLQQQPEQSLKNGLLSWSCKEIFSSHQTSKQHFSRKGKYFSGYVYDAVWLYALALEKLVQEDETYLQNLHSNRSSDALVKIITEIDFNGVSGRINFPGRSSRLSDIDIIQWCREGDTLIGDTVGVYKPDYTRYIQ